MYVLIIPIILLIIITILYLCFEIQDYLAFKKRVNFIFCEETKKKEMIFNIWKSKRRYRRQKIKKITKNYYSDEEIEKLFGEYTIIEEIKKIV